MSVSIPVLCYFIQQKLQSCSVYEFQLGSKTIKETQDIKMILTLSTSRTPNSYIQYLLTKMDKYFVPCEKHSNELILRYKVKSKLQSGIQAILLFTMCCKFPSSFSLYWLCKAKCSFWKKKSYSGNKSKFNAAEQVWFI